MYYKISSYALTTALLTHRATRADAECTEGTIASISGIANCNYGNFTAALNAAACTEAEFLALLPIDEDTSAKYTGPDFINELCDYDAPTQFVEIQGTYQKDKRYFSGGGILVDGEDWSFDSARLLRFNTNLAENSIIAWPNYAARLQYNIDNGLGTNGYPANMNLETSCELNTVMCCFTDDTKMDGASGAFPSTTDVCRHELHDSPQSNHIKEGWSVFPGSETSTYCTGFTWEDGQEDLLGNMMYDISLHNTIEHGFVKGVPGAPMCGCVEHMPVVEEAGCRTATAGDVVYTFSYDGGDGFSASNSATITYSDCETDLKAAYKANQKDGDDTAKALIDAHLVGAGGCEDDLIEYLNEEQFLLQGQHEDKYQTPNDKWSSIVVGEGVYFYPPLVDPIASDTEFRNLINDDCRGNGDPHSCIIRRICSSCKASHRDIYYKRLTALPPIGTNSTAGEVYFLDSFMNHFDPNTHGIFNVDFSIYSTYEDAVSGTNEWTYCHRAHVTGFPGYCGPSGWADQWNSYTVHGHGYANHHGYYVEKPATA